MTTSATRQATWCLLVVLLARASDTLSPEDLQDIEAFIDHTRVCRHAPGLTVTVVQGDKVLLARGFGVMDRDSGEAVTGKTPFPIGSISKNFVSTLLAIQLADRTDGVDWDLPLHCLPGSDIRFGDDLRSSQTTLRDVLSHRVGLPGYLWTLLTGVPENVTRADMVRRLQFMEPVQPFRTGFVYNNFLYGLAAHVAELLSHQGGDWESLNKDHLFGPAGMASSGYIDKTPAPPGLARPYTHINGSWHSIDPEATRFVHPLGPAGTIYSTAEDMAAWIQLHLAVISRMNPGSGPPLPFPGELTLSEAAVRRVWETYQSQNAEPVVTPQLTKPTYPISDVHMSYGMGWFNGLYRGYRKLYHAGGVSSYMSLLQLLPDLRAGIFLSTSGPGGMTGDTTTRLVAAYITDKLAGETPWLNTSTVCSFPAPWLPISGPFPQRPAVPLAPPIQNKEISDLTAYAGSYGHAAAGTLHVVSSSDGHLYLSYGRFGRARLVPTAVTGLYDASMEDMLWHISHADDFPMTMRVQFVGVRGGKAQEVLAEVDPMAVVTFRRGLDFYKVSQPPWRTKSDLYQCPDKGTCPKDQGL